MSTFPNIHGRAPRVQKKKAWLLMAAVCYYPPATWRDQRETTHSSSNWAAWVCSLKLWSTQQSWSYSTRPILVILEGRGMANVGEALMLAQSSEEVRIRGWWEPSTTLPKGNMYLIMEFAVNSLPMRINQFESVRPITIHVPVSVWDPSVAEQKGNLRNRKVTCKIFQFKSKHLIFLRHS